MIAKRFWGGLLLLPFMACTCGPCGGARQTVEPDPFADWKSLFDLALSELPEAKIDQPIEAIPAGLRWRMSSPDPEAWRAWAIERPFVKQQLATPLFEDLRMSELWLSIDGLRQQVSRAAALAGDADDGTALWRGPTALGAASVGAAPELVIVKRIDPAVRSLVRLGAAFALLKSDRVSEKQVGKLAVRTLAVRGQGVTFAVFRDLLVAGTDPSLVERAVALAQKDPLKQGENEDRPASIDVERGVLPAADTPGIHFAVELGDHELSGLFALETFGWSLVPDAAAPLILRRAGGEAPGSEALSLMRYAPASSFAVVVDGARPGATILGKLRAAIEEVEALPAKEKQKRTDLTELELEAQLAEQLQPGTALLLGTAEERELSPIVAFSHKSREKLEPVIRKLIEGLTEKSASRTVLEEHGGALLLAASEPGPCAAITADAVLFALDTELLRRAVAAGSGTAPSIGDRPGVELSGKSTGGVFIDLPGASAFLSAFYQSSFDGDDRVGRAEVDQVLGPSFTALATGGALFSKLEGAGEAARGPLKVLP